MSKKAVKIIAIVIAATLILGLLGPLAYVYVFSVPAEAELTETDVKINELSAKLEAAEKLEREVTEDCGERLRAMCENGTFSYLDVIFSSENLSDFTDNLIIARELAEYDKNVLNTIRSVREEIAESKNELEIIRDQNA